MTDEEIQAAYDETPAPTSMLAGLPSPAASPKSIREECAKMSLDEAGDLRCVAGNPCADE